MSKEKIIGLSVISVLTATLAGITAWRMLGGKPVSVGDAPPAVESTDTQSAETAPAGPTVLASATSGDSIADRLSGKSKIHGGWETTAPASTASADPALPSGAQGIATTAATDYRDRAAEISEPEHERQPSYMPRETNDVVATTGDDRYLPDAPATDSLPDADGPVDENTAGIVSGETTLLVPNELAPAEDDAADSLPNNFEPAAAGGLSVPNAADSIQIVENEPAPRELSAEQMAAEAEAERYAIRAADDARFTRAMAKEAEAVQIAGESLAPQPTAAYVANEVPVEETSAAPTDAAPLVVQTQVSGSRFAADPRYAPVAENEPAPASITANVTPVEASVPVEEEPVAGYRTSAPAAEPPTAESGYRDSVYREPAAVPYQAATRSTPVSTGSMPVATAQKSIPSRENTGKYYVEPGDSFWIIAKKVYGNGGFFKALQEHNRARFITPSNLQVGDEVLTPSIADLREQYSGLCPKERIAKPGSPAAMQVAHQPAPGSVKQYEVQAGDTLFDIARYELGDAKRWPEIYQLNRVALGADIDYVKPGTKLLLPMDAPLEAAPAEESYRGDVLTRQPSDLRQR